MNPLLSRRQFSVLGAVAGAGVVGVAIAFGTRPRGALRVEGTSALSPFMVAVARGFHMLHPGEEVEVRSSTDEAALAALRAKAIDLAMISRELGPAELGLSLSRVAIDGVVMVVHAGNHTLGMPPEAWRELFAGVKRDWRGYGGPDARVTLLVRPEGSAARALVHAHLGITRVRPDAVQVDGDARMIDRLRVDPGAVGYGSMTLIDAAIRAGAPLRALPLGAAPPTMESVLSGAYPLRNVLSLVSRRGAPSGARELLAYVESAAGRGLLRAHGYAPARV